MSGILDLCGILPQSVIEQVLPYINTGGAIMRIGILAGVLVILATPALAQTVIQHGPFQPSPFTDATIRVTASFRVAALPAEGQQIPSSKVQEAARREIYQMAENECAILADVHKGECRLGSVTITPFFGSPNPAQQQHWIAATAGYEIRPKR